jgi:hypothetical protein
MPRRPERVLHFAWNPAAGGAVEPPIAEATTGWSTGQRPPAPYLNALHNNTGQWLDFLRGPSLSRWTRVALPTPFVSGSPVIAADRESVEGLSPVRRLVVAGTDATGRCVHVGFRGDTWVRRANFPVGVAGDFTRAYFANGYWWLLLANGGAGYLLTSPADQAAGSALDGSVNWTLDAGPSGGYVALAHSAEAAFFSRVLVTTTGLYFASGATSAPSTFGLRAIAGSAPLGTYTDVVWDGTTYVAVTSSGSVVTGNLSTFTGLTARITLETGISWRLSVGAGGELLAWRAAGDSTLSRSTDHGASWTAVVPLPVGFGALLALVYADGTWVATSSLAPYVWSSNDLMAWTRAPMPVADAAADVTTGITHCEGAWIALSYDHVSVGARAEDLAPGAWSPDPTPTALGNAGYLRGRKLSVTAPTDGQVYAWSASANALVPTTVSAGGGAAFTAGTFAARPASPAAGDTYFATDLAATIVCHVAGTWAWPHGGPLAATRGPILGGAGNWIAAGSTDGSGPVGGPGYSIALGLQVDTLPGGTERCLAECFSTIGWLLGVSTSTANRFYLLQAGMSSGAKMELGDMVLGSCVIALSISATQIRWSINGAAIGGGGAGSAGGSVAISGTYTPPDSGSRFVLGNNHSGNFAFIVGSLAFFAAWNSILSDAALTAISAAYATYLPGESGAAPVASWLAGQASRYAVAQELRGAQGCPLVVNPPPPATGWTAR